MAVFEYNNQKIYYQIDGVGKPIILLNGIMMTTASWEPIMKSLIASNKVIRLDLLDQGQSSKQTNDYTISDQAELVKNFIDYLSLDEVNLVGISYGGYVLLDLASKYPNLVNKMIIFNSAADVSNRDAEMFKQFMHVADLNDPYAFYLTTIPLFYSPTFYENNVVWMEKREQLLIKFFENNDYRQTIKRLANSCLSHNVKNRLSNITSETLIVSGDEDYLIPYPKQQYLLDHIKKSYLVTMGKTGHVSIYENPVLFTSLIYGFINNPNFNFSI